MTVSKICATAHAAYSPKEVLRMQCSNIAMNARNGISRRCSGWHNAGVSAVQNYLLSIGSPLAMELYSEFERNGWNV